MTPITHYSLLNIHGSDAKAFLQGQLINDVNALDDLPANDSQLTGWCTPKGRLISVFRLWKSTTQNDGYYVRCPAKLVPIVLPRLRMFVMRSSVQIDDLTASHQGFWSAKVIDNDDAISVNVTSGWECWLPAENVELTDFVVRSPEPCSDTSTRELAEINSGLPEVFASSSEKFIPQMLNLDRLNGMSLKKGCYPGQEITARMTYRGQVKRRMYAVTQLDTTERPVPGTAIVDYNGATIGEWVRAVVNNNRIIGLAVMRLEYIRNVSQGEDNTQSKLVQTLQLTDNDQLIVSLY